MRKISLWKIEAVPEKRLFKCNFLALFLHPLKGKKMYLKQKAVTQTTNLGVLLRDNFSHTSLAFSFKLAKKLAFKGNHILLDVTRSIVFGSHLWSYLESKGSLTVTSLIHFMRSHLSKKDSSSALAKMSNSVQNLNESTYDFVVKLMVEREKV